MFLCSHFNCSSVAIYNIISMLQHFIVAGSVQCFIVAVFHCCSVSLLQCFSVAVFHGSYMFHCCSVALLQCFIVAVLQGFVVAVL